MAVISWYPGHMEKARRNLKEVLGRVDVAVELCDARIPQSSRNPMLLELLGNKPRIVLLNKADLADPKANDAWLAHFAAQDTPALCCDCQSGRGLNHLEPLVREAVQARLTRDANRGMKRSIRIVIAGIPNVGKSSLINRLSGRKLTKVEDRPGVTRTQQWIRLQSGLELLDTPGLLWPRLEGEGTAEHLAFVGSIRDAVTDVEELACRLCSELAPRYGHFVAARYGLDLEEAEGWQGFEWLEAIGKKRGFLLRGGEVDYLRAATILLDEFRDSRVGRISLEWPEAGA